jgi:hypothetical protein
MGVCQVVFHIRTLSHPEGFRGPQFLHVEFSGSCALVHSFPSSHFLSIGRSTGEKVVLIDGPIQPITQCLHHFCLGYPVDADLPP